MAKSILVIGAGLFGCIITRQLRSLGHQVELVDNQAPWAASKAAGCLIKPSWLSSMSREQQDAAYALLDETYGLQALPFKAGPKEIQLKFVSPDVILGESRVVAEVTDVGIGKGGPWARLTCGDRAVQHFGGVVIATGIAAGRLLPEGTVSPVKPQWGISYRIPGRLPHNSFSVWAPYRQLLKFNITDREIWLGDGAAWKEIGPRQELSSLDRAKAALEVDSSVLLSGRRMGARPYAEPTPGDPCYLKQVAPGLWVATGGAKNGTMAAAWCAHKLGKVLS
jgi:glycine/D-amino acid oxidase-like deaminating enzyme